MADSQNVRGPRHASGDAIHPVLCRALEKRERAYLWTPADAISFVPRVLPTVYGDGRALFAMTTINQRPAYWIIRACSAWGCDCDRETSQGPNFAEFTDEILTDLESAFGEGRCGYSGNSLFFSKRERLKSCQCEQCAEEPVARWPMVDGVGGCSWSRMNWPKGFPTVPNPLNPWRDLLSENVDDFLKARGAA